MTLKELLALKPDQVVAEIRRQIRLSRGDAVENKSTVFAANGYYWVVIPGLKTHKGMRRRQLPALFKELGRD